MTNAALREHVTSIAFNLTLSKRQLNLLVALHHFKGYPDGGFRRMETSNPGWRFTYFPHFISTRRALVDRGLIRTETEDEPTGLYCTRAGELVAELLQEAGIYQERLVELGIKAA